MSTFSIKYLCEHSVLTSKGGKEIFLTWDTDGFYYCLQRSNVTYKTKIEHFHALSGVGKIWCPRILLMIRLSVHITAKKNMCRGEIRFENVE